jgi:hypothetical protein
MARRRLHVRPQLGQPLPDLVDRLGLEIQMDVDRRFPPSFASRG